MITIEINDDESLEEINRGKLHWSNIFDFDAVIAFQYDDQVIEFETMHHVMTLSDFTEGVMALLIKGKQSSFNGYGASYNKSLVIKRFKDRVYIELHIKKENSISIEISPRVLALDLYRALKKHVEYLSSFQRDSIGTDDLEGLRELIKELKIQ